MADKIAVPSFLNFTVIRNILLKLCSDVAEMSTPPVVDVFNGNGSTTSFTLSQDPGTVDNTVVFISATYQQKDAYTLNGTTITFSAAPPSGTKNIQVHSFGTRIMATPTAGSISNTHISNSANIGMSKTNYATAIIIDQKSNGTNGGNSVAGTQQRVLNTIKSDPSGIIKTLSSNTFELYAGKYFIEGSAPAYNTGVHKCWLYNSTSGAVVAEGTSEYASANQTRSSFRYDVTLAVDTVFYLGHTTSGAVASNGLGVGSSVSLNEVYSEVKVVRLS